MEDKRTTWVNKPKAWSVSRRTLMEQCPRAWALKYGFARRNTRTFNRILTEVSDWSSPWRLMLRALRGVIIERLELASKGKDWSESDLAARIRFRIIGSLERQRGTTRLIEKRIGVSSRLKMKVGNQEIGRLVEIASHRFNAVMACEPISSILEGKITDWFLADRLEKTSLKQYKLHVAPDIAWRKGRRWHLLRLAMQGGREPGPERVLESMSMVLWALSNSGMPVLAERYEVSSLTWNKGSWRKWSMTANDEQVKAATELIKLDMKAMCDLHYRLGPSCDLSQMPLASNRRNCTNCGHVDTCPGGEDLHRARLEQSALEMAKATKS